ncbi:MAG: flagellar hook-length control protein FliK, partial [Deltaproteobacteria bacterium]|nr:flagellar hook-length control protein FliK [Deltaproteobacteria bacterium]
EEETGRSVPQPAKGPLNPLPGLEKTAPVSDGPFGENADVLKSGNEQAGKPPEGMMPSGEEETGRSVPQPAKGPLNPLPGLEKTAPVSVEADNEKDYVLRPESAMRKGAGGLDKGMINSGVKPLLSEEFFLESGLTEAKTNRFFDETKTEKNVDLNKRDLLFKLNSINQEPEKVTDNLSKNFANQDSNPNLASDLQNNKPANTKIQVFDSDIFSNKIDKIESDKGADDLLSLNGQSSDKVSRGISTTKETSSLPKALETDVLSQIVKKAALNLKNGQTQVKIEIKPESLGHLRMQISTENHQVTAKIMAETPLVKEIIENNIHQLKTELQNHGLEIDKFDVDVFGSDVSDQNGAEYKNPSFLKKAGETDEDKVENGLPEVKEESLQVSEERRGTNAIDFFA